MIFNPITEILILITSLGLGLYVKNLFNLNDANSKNINFSEVCLYGFCIILPCSQFINLFSPIKEIYFWLIFIFSSFYIYLDKTKFSDFYKWLKKIFILFLILLPMKLVVKGHDDLFYHISKINILNNYKIVLGIGNYYESYAFTNGWSHVSAFFNFLNGAEKNLYTVVFVFFILALDSLYHYFKETKINTIKIFCLVSILFLGLKFYRLQEFGNDYQSIILIFIIFFYYLKYFLYLNKFKYNNDSFLKKIIFFSVFASLFKIHGILVIILLAIFIYDLKKIINRNFIKLYFALFFVLILTFTTSFLNSGCLMFPFEKSCFSSNKISWSMKDDVKKIKLNLDTFNKSYPVYVNESKKDVLSKEEWLENFNWFKYHFTNEQVYAGLLKTIFILTTIFLIFLKYFKLSFKKISLLNFLFFILSIVLIIIWGIKIPLMRASGYGYIACSYIFLFCSLINEKDQLISNFNQISKKFLIFLFIFIFISNSIRIYKEFKKYNTNDFYFYTYYYKPNNEYYFDNFIKNYPIGNNNFKEYIVIKN